MAIKNCCANVFNNASNAKTWISRFKIVPPLIQNRKDRWRSSPQLRDNSRQIAALIYMLLFLGIIISFPGFVLANTSKKSKQKTQISKQAVSQSSPQQDCDPVKLPENVVANKNTQTIKDVVLKLQEGFKPRVNLESELKKKYHAGGRIQLSIKDGQLTASIDDSVPASREEEMQRRRANWKVFRKVNIASAGAWNSSSTRITNEQEVLLKKFALSDAGAVWIREVISDDVDAFNRGLLRLIDELSLTDFDEEMIKDKSLDQVVAGGLSEDAIFIDDSFHLFKVYGYQGPGAQGSHGGIGLGSEGLKKRFSVSQQKVDPLAIISHEFGHTVYGDPMSGADIRGEAATVRNYENPVRAVNGYEARQSYYHGGVDKTIDVHSGKIYAGKVKVPSTANARKTFRLTSGAGVLKRSRPSSEL